MLYECLKQGRKICNFCLKQGQGMISIVALYFSPSESSYLSLCLIKMHNAKIVQTNVTECMYSVFHSCFNKFSVEITMPYALSM